MKAITFINDKPFHYYSGSFGSIYKENDYIVFIGTAKEVRTLYKKLSKRWNFKPFYQNFPKFNDDRIYGISIERKNNLFVFNVLSEHIVCAMLVEILL